MPLHENAKPGSKEFDENVATEVKAGKDKKQAVVIAYAKARGDSAEEEHDAILLTRNDMSDEGWDKLKSLINEWVDEEKKEPEHKDSAEQGEEIVLRVTDDDNSLAKMLAHIKRASGIGHSFTVIVDPDTREYTRKFGIDGDGAFRIHSISPEIKNDEFEEKVDSVVEFFRNGSHYTK
jgi:hypothetical protein